MVHTSIRSEGGARLASIQVETLLIHLDSLPSLYDTLMLQRANHLARTWVQPYE